MERNNENNINNEIYLNQHKHQDAEIKFNEDLANQEWVNERDSIRYRLFSAGFLTADRVLPILSSDIYPFSVLHAHNVLYHKHQNKFEKSLSLGNRIFSIDTGFANNIEYNQMFQQKYFVDIQNSREVFYYPNGVNIIATAYVQFHLIKKSLYDNQEISKLLKNDAATLADWSKQPCEGLDSKNISFEYRKEFNDMTNNFFDLPNTHMKSVAEFLIKHSRHSDTFFAQGQDNLHLNLNGNNESLALYQKDLDRNIDLAGRNASDYNSRTQETLSYYSRHMILCFFRPEYLFSDKKPNPELIEFYVALNSLLSVAEKENAKAILNADEKKLTDQQRGLKKKLLGKDKEFRDNIINAWKNGFFLDKNKIKESNKLFTEKEKKFEAAFYKNKVMDLVIEIEHGNLNLIPEGQENNIKVDLASKNDDEKVNFLVEQLFNGARITDKDNKTYLKLNDQDLKYSDKEVSEKLKPIANRHKFPPKSAFVYDEKNGFVKIIDWLISEIENGNLKLMLQGQNNDFKNDLLGKNNNDDKVKFLVLQLFNGASVVDKNKNDITYLEFSGDERDEYSKSDLQEKLKLIDNKIQSCAKAAKILKPSDFNLNDYNYEHLKKERLSELLYFQDDEQKRDYIYLRENKNYYRDYILHKDYGENELYNKLYQCTQKADFGKYKREHFIFDETGKIIGMDVLACFADKIVSGELKLKDNEDKDISDEVKNIDNDLAREVFLMDKLKNDNYHLCDNENKEIKMSFNNMTKRAPIIKKLKNEIKTLIKIENGEANENTQAIYALFNNLYSDGDENKDIKDFIKMFRLEKEDIIEIAKNTKQVHALIQRYALNKIFAEKIKPVNQQGKELIGDYVFDFSGTNCERDDLVFAKDGRVEYVKYESLPKVLKLDDIETNELKARNKFIGAYEQKEKYKSEKTDIEISLYDVKISNGELPNKLKEKYKVNEENSNSAKKELNDLRTNLDSNACANLSDFYDLDSYRDEFLDKYIKFYQDAQIDYEYWATECAQKFLKDIKEKKEKSDDEIADIELKFFKGQKIELKDLSQYTKNNKQEEITDIELKLFEENKIKFNNLSKYTKDNKQEKIAEIEFKLLKENELNGDRKTIRQLQKQKSKLMSLYYRLAPEEIDNQNKLKQVCIDGETIHYALEDTESQQLRNGINDWKRQNINLYKLKNIPYKNWDSGAKQDYFDELQWRWFKIGCIPLSILILSVVSFFLPFIEGYLVIKIIFTSGSFVCGCLVAGKGIKNDKDCDYRGKDTYDSPSYSYPNDNVIKPPVNVAARQQNMNIDILSEANLNTTIINTSLPSNSTTSSPNNKQSEKIDHGLDPKDTNINTNSTSSSSSGSSEQSHESTTDLRQCTDPNPLEINLKHLKPDPLTMVNEIKTEDENNIPEFDPNNETKNDPRDKDKNIIEQEPGNH